MLPRHLSSVLTFFVCVACGGATAIVPDDGSGGSSENGGATGSGGRSTGGIPGVGGKPTGGVTGTGGKPAGGVTGAGGKPAGGVTGAGGKPAGGVTRWAKEYDQSCKFDSDCAGVTEGATCTCYGCTNAAINRNEYGRWSSAGGPCPSIPCDPVGCEEMVPACYGGTCGVRPSYYIEPGQFDRTCSLQSDCYLITVGDLCSGCNCEFDAVSVKGLEQYKERVVNGPTCGSPGIECDCATPRPVCVNNGSGRQCTAVY